MIESVIFHANFYDARSLRWITSSQNLGLLLPRLKPTGQEKAMTKPNTSRLALRRLFLIHHLLSAVIVPGRILLFTSHRLRGHRLKHQMMTLRFLCLISGISPTLRNILSIFVFLQLRHRNQETNYCRYHCHPFCRTLMNLNLIHYKVRQTKYFTQQYHSRLRRFRVFGLVKIPLHLSPVILC